ncbi:hypothetical protein PUV52_06850 [Leuconostoc mesenteroides]|uniref:Uncharacterized protein n=1 Tax=Leuconostoc mesenteroides subsp. mesenteroides (strain ATCC 8293 / DSM 20343 / BCRC 11652 / CCM 1803 / JCM 6124 / NCDO 523 / NBRC 100496 / NCIMB 8023 / NCTC 12954 / NRRL B-1118 / 37Y) TaxID=203120 RepID=Q03XB2_LEUMM|nr:hypothetical protein [Leuconostoc mesenteroides]ABJ62160.1 hypothetical protein LEUM_1060 [Leuconostoc mesenteroides subsp. mesenteroides ATCC 8293]MCT3043018.1 hypothetical protein [Leuconostoc mesenteroides]MDG9747128.1 hypothetical protein [Leuconostoc mesenteroides]QQB31041.1 hypothetical protein I6H90_09415 [Leuconostoc mesenteroides]STY37228.1 Uncharacterised protein [Leuconostoc mesenteroides]
MKDAIEFKTSQMKALIKRRNVLNKKYDTTLPEDIPLDVKSELKFIDKILQEFDIDEEIFAKQGKTINIKNSRNEEWYFQQMKHWAERNPRSTNGQFGKSTLYRFALHFFVENIALNANNARLNYSELAQKVNDANSTKSDSKLTAQLANVENLLGFLLTMQQCQLEYIPEGINLENGFVKYAINPINPTEFQQFGTPTELNPSNELAQSYEEYKKIRSRDKQLIKKYHQTGGQLDDD